MFILSHMKQLFIFFLLLQGGAYAQVPLAELSQVRTASGKIIFQYQGSAYTGSAISYHENGNMNTLRNFQKGRPSGKWTTYDEAGKVLDTGDETHLYYQALFLPPQGYEDASPSFTETGNYMVFARYVVWGKKVPYIAEKIDGEWIPERLPFADTVYNLAISPEGTRIVYTTADEVEIRRAYYVDKEDDSWGAAVEITAFEGIYAGYFQIMKDGSLYFFAREPKIGIYYAEASQDGSYGTPRWLSDEVSLADGDSFDAFLHPGKEKLIISQYYSQQQFPERGEVGMYYYEKADGRWERQKRLPLSYGWGATITPDNTFIFVRNGMIQYLPLADLGIAWE